MTDSLAGVLVGDLVPSKVVHAVARDDSERSYEHDFASVRIRGKKLELTRHWTDRRSRRYRQIRDRRDATRFIF